MNRKIVSGVMTCLIFLFSIIVFNGVADAASFTTSGIYSMNNMPPGKVWKNKCETSDGMFMLRFKKLDKPDIMGNGYHLNIWLGHKALVDRFYPELTGDHYEYAIFKEIQNGLYFFALYKDDKAVLYGYNRNTGKFQSYASSEAVADGGASKPRFSVTADGQIQLYFYSTGDQYAPRYKLIFNVRSDSFTYQDITVARPVVQPVAPDPDYSGSDTYYEPDNTVYDEVIDYQTAVFEDDREGSGVGNSEDIGEAEGSGIGNAL